jgi:hypothetical protein
LEFSSYDLDNCQYKKSFRKQLVISKDDDEYFLFTDDFTTPDFALNQKYAFWAVCTARYSELSRKKKTTK